MQVKNLLIYLFGLFMFTSFAYFKAVTSTVIFFPQILFLYIVSHIFTELWSYGLSHFHSIVIILTVLFLLKYQIKECHIVNANALTRTVTYQ